MRMPVRRDKNIGSDSSEPSLPRQTSWQKGKRRRTSHLGRRKTSSTHLGVCTQAIQSWAASLYKHILKKRVVRAAHCCISITECPYSQWGGYNITRQKQNKMTTKQKQNPTRATMAGWPNTAGLTQLYSPGAKLLLPQEGQGRESALNNAGKEGQCGALLLFTLQMPVLLNC